MFAANSPFNIASRVGQDKIHVESIPLGSSRFRLWIRKGEHFPSTELELTNRTTLEIRGGHGKALMAAHGQGQGTKEEWDSPDSSSSSESPKSTDSDDSNGTMSP
ncbi:hypothetical protein K457DRAFT_1821836 [Linnemannia elongata AG-77]|uniref:Uncharacterized protein n=1 Tax=Linnemannia elongata AG-77 TaxID=1314771 RepID=A0A197JR40_9FUNG|nr:hypothetical protein K457DRAFT_1821836 [Linnemannia elongata AG-77]